MGGPATPGHYDKGGVFMAISKAQQAAVKKYNDANYDRIEIKVPKGEKEVIKAAAEAAGESSNQYIYKAIQSRLAADPERE